MMEIYNFLAVSTIVFTIGLIGVLVRRNIMIILMSLELMLNAVNLNLVAFSRLWGGVVGHVFVIFVITVAAAEAAVGLAIVIAVYRHRESINIDDMNLLKW
ncbi:MAG TPA: NADH-quinone oxidoreductase subunit NuoK [Acidobacteriota bacterium]|nr:NADH-quinone oxidoreductase subunit NuoK [Acidobacteriota bacterium]NLI45855.1 NADH-quinone oxidoreductase subunit NuoK [Acidobacteriota bacterium]HNR37754.1 NADH-quinone oxidoreductase subunit NuoK [Acidobacteriota bacterium]HNT99249.1 NADH-quinone oxidoreductase subunit NuoK [Acidobacteriota bacterium]HOT01806.1 NADH-quinone oxidoreductase subunit NuoK [Acidobacteriota bacterium]